MTIQKVIDYVNDIKPHTFSDETLTGWINECEGHIQTEVLCIDISEVVVYEYEKNKDSELIVKAPHDKLYGLYLIAMIDFAHGEYAKYENTMQLYNNALDEFAKWFIRTHSKNDGSYEKRMHGYYLSAYGLAVLHGFVGTEDEWIASLKGEQGIQGIQGEKGDKGDPGNIESVTKSDENGYIKVNDGTVETEFCVYDDTEMRNKTNELSAQNSAMQNQINVGLEYAGNERAGLFGRISDVENRAGNLERGKEDVSNKMISDPIADIGIATDEQYYSAKAVAQSIYGVNVAFEVWRDDHIHNLHENQQHITPVEREVWNSKADGEEFNTIKAAVEKNTNERHNHENKDLLDTITKEKMEKWDSGGNGEAVTVIDNGGKHIIPMHNNTEVRCGVIESGSLYFKFYDDVAEDTYNSFACFTIGNEGGSDVLCVPGDGRWDVFYLKGDDVNSNGEFTPVAGATYEVAFKKVNVDSDGNSIIVGRVGRVM